MTDLIKLIEDPDENQSKRTYIHIVTFCHLLSSETFRTELSKQPNVPDYKAHIQGLVTFSKQVNHDSRKIIAPAVNNLYYKHGFDIEPIHPHRSLFTPFYMFAGWSIFFSYSLKKNKHPVKKVLVPSLIFTAISYSAFRIWDYFRPYKKRLRDKILDPSRPYTNNERFIMMNILDIFGIMYEFILIKYFKFTFFPYSFDLENYVFLMRKYPSLLR